MITENIERAFNEIKNSLTLDEVKGCFKLTANGVYLYRHSNGLAEIIDFISEEVEENYKTECEYKRRQLTTL